MKKVMATLVVLAVAGVAMADLSISLRNDTVFLKPGEVTPITSLKTLPVGAHFQLIWAPSNVNYQNGNMGLLGAQNWLEPGEKLLWEGAAPLGGGRITTPVADVYTDSDVGGVNVNAGYFYARIFQTDKASIGNGTYFVEIGIQGPALTEFDSLVPSSTYAASVGLAYASGTSITVQDSQVIPEPATIGLMGIAGLGMFLARRKARR